VSPPLDYSHLGREWFAHQLRARCPRDICKENLKDGKNGDNLLREKKA
jgi:hypothetical protein